MSRVEPGSWMQDIELIVDDAIAGVCKVIRLGPLVMFSTHTGDAWLLDPADRTAVQLARGGDPLPVQLLDSADEFGVGWTCGYAIDGDTFIVTERSTGRIRVIRGYAPELLDLVQRA